MFDKQSTTKVSKHRIAHDQDTLYNVETQMRCCAKALVALDRTRTYRSERSSWGRSLTDKGMLDHADPTDLSGQRDLDCASCTNLTGLMCVQEPCTSSRWRSVKGSRPSKARVLLRDLHVLVGSFYQIT